jgi:hypothetical protein
MWGLGVKIYDFLWRELAQFKMVVVHVTFLGPFIINDGYMDKKNGNTNFGPCPYKGLVG